MVLRGWTTNSFLIIFMDTHVYGSFVLHIDCLFFGLAAACRRTEGRLNGRSWSLYSGEKIMLLLCSEEVDLLN